ncbi:MAG: GDP-L-fucose synthase [Myxococcales bacterium]|nr:GDP-L-fucose synthase [Myxococcales bacterium]
MELAGKRIIVTGGAGFLGSHVVEALQQKGCAEIIVPRSADCDLVEREAVAQLYAEQRPDLVIHLAARVGGIGANQKNPGRYFHDNLQMGVHVIEEGRKFGVGKIVIAGTICSYPKHTPVPFREQELWNGYPEETNAPYGVAKKALLVMAQAYREQYGLNTVVLLPVNLYGPRDNFDLESSHVIPAMIRKCVDAQERGDDEIVLWGDGSPTREFLYVEDCARGLLAGAERYDGPEPINLGAGFEISMGDLAALIADKTGFEGALRWDTTRPNGQPRRCLDVSRARELLGFETQVAFEDGVARTIDWYRQHRDEIA